MKIDREYLPYFRLGIYRWGFNLQAIQIRIQNKYFGRPMINISIGPKQWRFDFGSKSFGRNWNTYPNNGWKYWYVNENKP